MEWLERKYGEINYNLTQFVTVYGGYRKYLYRCKLDTSSECPSSDRNQRTYSSYAVEERKNLEEFVGELLSPENFVQRMLTCQEDWDAINSMIAAIQAEFRNTDEVVMTAAGRMVVPRGKEETGVVLVGKNSTL